MTALTVPLALAVALHCAPTMDPAMLVGIARQESGLEPLTLRDDTSGEVLHGAGVVAAARRRIAAGHSVDLGLWQINSHNLSLLGLGVAEALEPCQAAAAAARLIELYSRYNTGSPSRGIANGYAAAVIAAVDSIKAAGAKTPPIPVAAIPLPASPPDPFARPAPTGPDLVFATGGK
jgi:type IV secretion system protein VirB1